MIDSKNFRFAALILTIFSSLPSRAGQLAERLLQNQQSIALLHTIRGDHSDDEAARVLAVADLLRIAELQEQSPGTLALDSADQKIFVTHFRVFAHLLVAGRVLRRAGLFDQRAREMDDDERETRRSFDEYIPAPRREALARAYPALARALKKRHLGFQTMIIMAQATAAGFEPARSDFGRVRVNTALAWSFPLGLLLHVPVADLHLRRSMVVAQGLLGLARYLHVRPQTGFCGDALER